MGAYNWIIINAKCPNCGHVSNIKCQTHVASSYNGTDFRFHDRTYAAGDTMAWFSIDHPEYDDWKQGNSKLPPPNNEDNECCHASCATCKKECFVVINFDECKIVGFQQIRKLEKWPDDFISEGKMSGWFTLNETLPFQAVH